MISNFFKVAFRVFMRNRTQTLLNIFGLAIGISFSIIIFLYANKELSFDRFHKNAERIYRIGIDGMIADNNIHTAVTPNPLAKTIAKEIPEVEDAVRIARFGAWLVRNDTIGYNEDNIIFTDPGFFNIFSFPLIKGSPEKALSKPKSLVLSELSAKRYFGDVDPMGKRLRIENDSVYYTVTGVMRNIPDNSHMQFDMVGTLSTFDKILNDDRWIINYLYTYILIREPSTATAVQQGLNRIVSDKIIPDFMGILDLKDVVAFNSANFYHLQMQPLTDIHLNSDYASEIGRTGKLSYINLFIVLAFVILVLSCLNFISLVTAQSISRAREVSIRKISGSEKGNLIKQFLLESSLLAFFGLTLGLLVTELMLPSFSEYIGFHLSLMQLLNSTGFLFLVILILTIGIISGIYPAWYLSMYNPSDVLRNIYNNHPDKGHFRKVLAGFQLFLAIGAISMALTVMAQYKFLISKDRGYQTKNLLVIRRPDALTNRLDEFKKDILKHTGIISATNASSALGSGFPKYPFYLEGSQVTENYTIPTMLVGYDFDSTYLITMAAGRFFHRTYDDSSACVINQTAAQTMGLKDPIGKTLIQLSDKKGTFNKYKIIGVTNDFYFETLENPLRPLCILLMPGNLEGYLTVRMTPENQDSTISYLKKVWENYTNAYPFVYYFLDKDRTDYYKPVLTTARIFKLLAIINSIMACLSLIAFISFTNAFRSRQIGIRKAIGASNTSIILCRAREVFWIVLIASVLAWTGVLILVGDWLNDYAYHINIHAFYFLAASVCVLIISQITVWYYTHMASKVNSGNAFKYD